MIREIPPFGKYIDNDVQHAINWIKGHLSQNEWINRYSKIEQSIRSKMLKSFSGNWMIEYPSISIREDRIGWYLYISDAAFNNPIGYDPNEGARIIPILKRLGSELDVLKKIEGIEDKIIKMLTIERSQPDATIFEILVALLWIRNGYENVKFIGESPPNKRPDISAHLNGYEWNIECKRLSMRAEYSINEKNKWSKMWGDFRKNLKNKYSMIFEMTFHVELSSLPDNFLSCQLLHLLPNITIPCKVIDNDKISVNVRYVNYDKIKEHLVDYLVKFPSEQFIELIGGKRDNNFEFTAIVSGKFSEIGDHKANNIFLDDVEFASAAYWQCDNQQSINTKARDIRKRLSSAVQQLPKELPSIVHIFLETLDGSNVEIARNKKIYNTMKTFNADGKNLAGVYCHLIQSYAPPDQAWVIDETVHYFKKGSTSFPEPIKTRSIIIPEHEADDNPQNIPVHWLRPSP
ncbi:MAG: hypothetical protein ACRC7D_22070 [Aeromonas popoffii]|uniref:hypothetical protein n=1 Tax=Aeromonas popoffii TaxID=70856 RepID=UPI003F3BC461